MSGGAPTSGAPGAAPRPRARILAATAAALLLAGIPGVARADAVDRYVEARMREMHLPGVSLAVVRDGRVVKTKGYGLASLELGAAATPETVYEIGSVTKQFTAAAVLLLAEEGRLGLDDPIAGHLAGVPDDWSDITIRHLLQHTAGIQNHVAVPGYLGAFRTSILGDTFPPRDELLAMFFRLPREFRAGGSWAYDNTGYHLLGSIVEKADGRPFWDVLRARLFDPIGMTATRSTDARPLVARRAAGYEWTATGWENRPALPPFVAFSAGSLLSTAGDLARWDAALGGAPVRGGGRLLSDASRRAMWTAARTGSGGAMPLDYGFGWFLDSYHGHRVVQHGGGTPGFSSHIARFIDDRLTIILLTNHGDRLLDTMAIDIAGMYEPALRRPPPGPAGRAAAPGSAAADPDPALSRRLEAVLSGLLAGRRDDGAFTPAMRIHLGTATGRGLWQWYASHGALTSFTYADGEDTPYGRVARYRAGMDGVPYWVSFLVAPDAAVAQVRWW